MAERNLAQRKTMRLRMLSYLILESIHVWQEKLIKQDFDYDFRRNKPAFFPSLVCRGAVDLIRMGYPVRCRIEFRDPWAAAGFDLIRSPDYEDMVSLMTEMGLIIKPDSYYPIYQLSVLGEDHRQIWAEKIDDLVVSFQEFTPEINFQCAVGGLIFDRDDRYPGRKPVDRPAPRPVRDVISDWADYVIGADLVGIRLMWIDAAVLTYLDGDWIGDFTFHYGYANLTRSPRDYRALIAEQKSRKKAD